jgi:hypothetical protein
MTTTTFPTTPAAWRAAQEEQELTLWASLRLDNFKLNGVTVLCLCLKGRTLEEKNCTLFTTGRRISSSLCAGRRASSSEPCRNYCPTVRSNLTLMLILLCAVRIVLHYHTGRNVIAPPHRQHRVIKSVPIVQRAQHGTEEIQKQAETVIYVLNEAIWL